MSWTGIGLVALGVVLLLYLMKRRARLRSED
jgi:hypothetical protein